MQFTVPPQLSTIIIDWLAVHGVRIVLILIAALVLEKIAHSLLGRVIRRAVRPGRGRNSARDEKQREETLTQTIGGAVYVLIWTSALLMVLSEVGVAIGPLLAAAGVAGVAVGFGAQYLIRDIITGLFILLENQYRTGDVVCFGQTCGSVENITLRKTTLRDLDGTVHHMPHGSITQVSNLSNGYARVNLNIGISYSASLEKVIEVVNATGKELAEDPKWKNDIISAPQFLRVDEFAESSIVLKILGDTEPLRQWDVTGELRKRIKVAFDREGIEIPFPQRVIHQAQS